MEDPNNKQHPKVKASEVWNENENIYYEWIGLYTKYVILDCLHKFQDVFHESQSYITKAKKNIEKNLDCM